MTTRQQRRARARAPVNRKRTGGTTFLVATTALLVLGGVAVYFLRENPPELKRGALTTDHWHAPYELQICGKPIEPYPQTSGEIHTHGDGLIHLHPKTAAYSGDKANLGAFFASAESMIGVDENDKRFLGMPDQTVYRDGGTCEGIEGTWELVVLKDGEPVLGDPHKLIIHDGDKILIRYGPEPEPGTSPAPNPLTQMMEQFQQMQDPGFQLQQEDAPPPG